MPIVSGDVEDVTVWADPDLDDAHGHAHRFGLGADHARADTDAEHRARADARLGRAHDC